MNPSDTTATWAETLAVTVRHALAQMDTTLTLTEAKIELTRHLFEVREAWEGRPS